MSKRIAGNFIRPLVSRDASHLRFTSSLWLGRDKTSDKRVNCWDAVLLGAKRCTVGSARCRGLGREGAGSCIGVVDRAGDVDSEEQSRFLRYSLLEGSSIIYKVHQGISVSDVKRDRGQLHQTFGVEGRVAFTNCVFPLAEAGRNF